MRVVLVLAATVAGLIGSALLILAAEAADPAKPYLGMSKEAIIACAGEPYAKYRSGAEAETLTYHYSGAGPVPAPPGEKKKKEGGLAGFFPGGKDKTDKQDEQAEAGAASEDAGEADNKTGKKKNETAEAGDASEKVNKRGKKKGAKKDSGWTCTASLVFESGRLAQVSFAHKDVRSPYDWQKEKNPEKQEAMRNKPLPTCTFSLPNCHPAQ
jgi:hypothetical protein